MMRHYRRRLDRLAMLLIVVVCVACSPTKPGNETAKPAANGHAAGAIRRTAVDSTAMRSVGYDANQRILAIEFHNGAVYHYFDVPRHIHAGLMAAESHGRYFHQLVRDAGYRYQRMN